MMRDEDHIAAEAPKTFDRNHIELAKDVIRGANTPGVDSELTKQLVKHIALHLLALDRQARNTNRWLLILTALSVVGLVVAVLQAFEIVGGSRALIVAGMGVPAVLMKLL